MNRPVGLQWPGRKRHLPPAVDVGLTPLLRLPGTLADSGAVRLIRGEALQVAERLLHEGLRGHIDVIHLDPPFGSQVDYARLRDLRIIGADGTPRTIPLQLPAYGDTDADDLAGYLDDLEPVLQRCRELLSARGSLYVHLDFRRGPYVRMLLDELFGADHLVNEIVWAYGLGGSSATRFQRKHDILYFYARDLKHHWFRAPQQAATSSLLLGQPKRATDVWVTEGREDEDRIVNDWPDALVEKTLSNRDPERTGYPTQKNESLLRRIIQASSNPGDLVLDAFAGASTTGVVAASEGRRFLLIDASPVALSVSRARLVSCRPPPSFQVFAPPPTSLDLERLTFESGQLRVSADKPPGARAVTAIYVDLDYQPPVFRCSAFALRDRADERPLSIEFEPPPRGRTLAVQIDDEAGKCARGPLPVL